MSFAAWTDAPHCSDLNKPKWTFSKRKIISFFKSALIIISEMGAEQKKPPPEPEKPLKEQVREFSKEIRKLNNGFKRD